MIGVVWGGVDLVAAYDADVGSRSNALVRVAQDEVDGVSAWSQLEVLTLAEVFWVLLGCSSVGAWLELE